MAVIKVEKRAAEKSRASLRKVEFSWAQTRIE
jgi:hypothetical protein